MAQITVTLECEAVMFDSDNHDVVAGFVGLDVENVNFNGIEVLYVVHARQFLADNPNIEIVGGERYFVSGRLAGVSIQLTPHGEMSDPIYAMTADEIELSC